MMHDPCRGWQLHRAKLLAIGAAAALGVALLSARRR
jgi:hypothetical protein